MFTTENQWMSLLCRAPRVIIHGTWIYDYEAVIFHPPPPVYQSLDAPLLYKSYPESLLPDWKAIQWLNRTSIIAPCYNTRRRGVSGSAVYWFNGIRIRHHCIANLRFPLKQKLKKKEETIKTKVNKMIEAPKTVNLIYKVIHIHDQGMCLVRMCRPTS